MSEPAFTPLEIVGDTDAGICIEGVCAVPDTGTADDSESR
jgi:hypothetical protein